MAYFIRIIKARRLKNNWKRCLNEKEITFNGDEFDDSSSNFEEKVHRERYINHVETPYSITNLLWKTLVGFIGGVLITYLFFFFFYIGVNVSLKTTTWICGLAGVFLCLGIAFSSLIRCYVLLLLPVFFSKHGRQALLAYAFFLAFTGPANNTMHNLEILSDSLTCGQEMVKKTLLQIFEMVRTPAAYMKETIEKVTTALKEAEKSVQNHVMKVKRLIVSIVNVIKKATSWLRSIIKLCNRKIGTPFQRCMKTFEDGIADCKAKLGMMDFFCHVVHIVKALCYSVKCLDFMCTFTEFLSDKIIGVVKKKLREFNLRVKNLFFVSIEFSNAYEGQITAVNTTQRASKTTLKKIAKRIEEFESIVSFFGFTFSLIFFFLFFKVYSYKYKYLSSDQYDNVYLSKYIVALDIKRARMERETVLPLEPRERKKYAKPSAIRLLEIEKIRIAQSMSFLIMTSFKILSFLLVDYGLFSMMLMIYQTGYDAVLEVEKSKYGIHVGGKGFLADFYRSLGNTLQVPGNSNLRLTPIYCLPDPVYPDKKRYIQIGFLIILCWILTLTEAYGLRLRNVVMSHYYPDRAKERAVWLYNHILQSRGYFLRHARRKLRRKYCEQFQPMGEVCLMQRLFANFPLIGTLFGGNEENDCLICGPQSDANLLKKCKTPDCRGQYCMECFNILQNICTICQHPIEYGDVSDLSEEIDSSEEELCNEKTYKYYPVGELAEKSPKTFLTFKDMEVRDRFTDLESNKFPDYATLSDLYESPETVRKPATIQQKHNKKEKNRSINHFIYKQIRLRVENLISNLKKKKIREISLRKAVLKKKFAEKIHILKYFKRKKKLQFVECMQNGPIKNVSFKFDPEVQDIKDLNYEKLKERVRKKVKLLKEQKSLEGEDGGNNSSKTSSKIDNKSSPECSDDVFGENSLSYCHVESEKDFGFSKGEEMQLDEKSNDIFSSDSLNHQDGTQEGTTPHCPKSNQRLY